MRNNVMTMQILQDSAQLEYLPECACFCAECLR